MLWVKIQISPSSQPLCRWKHLDQIFKHVKYKQFPGVAQGQQEPGPLKQECKKTRIQRLIQIQCSEKYGLSSVTIIHQPKVATTKDSFKTSLWF